MATMPLDAPQQQDVAVDGHRVRRRLGTAALLALLVLSLLIAVPGLRGVLDEVGEMRPDWVLAAVALELASSLSFVVVFRWFFDSVPKRQARRLAWTEMASGALLPGGGVGGLAVGGWLMSLAGTPKQQIVRRSSALFFLTSAINVAAVAGAGLVLATGLAAGPHDALRTGLPIAAAVAATALVLALPSLTGRRDHGSSWVGDLAAGIGDARRALARPSWRLSGAVGWLAFDIAVLWATFMAVGGAPPLAALVLAYMLGYLANTLPVPAGIGVLDSGLAGTLILYGAPATHAAAAVLVYHAIAFWVPGLGGLLGYALLRRGLVGSEPATARRTLRSAPALHPRLELVHRTPEAVPGAVCTQVERCRGNP